jgi:hypothetical protein
MRGDGSCNQADSLFKRSYGLRWLRMRASGRAFLPFCGIWLHGCRLLELHSDGGASQ